MATSGKGVDLGLFVLRVGIGLVFICFGWPKITGGPDGWVKLGGAMKSVYGIGWLPVFWGFMAALAEFGGGIALVLGLFVRPFAAIMAFTMATATAMLCSKGLMAYAHALDMGIVFVALLIAGGGSYALGALLPGLRDRWYR